MYTSYFGFREKPFNVTPNPKFFYANTKNEEAYANLLYGIRERKGFMLLTGEVGTGKTTILQRLMQELESTVPFVFFYNTTLPFEDLLTYVCDELGLTIQGGGQLAKINALNAFLLDQLSKGSSAVLFVDEAQNLHTDVFENLRLLSNLETPREKLLQIILAGQPELDAKLNRTELRQLKQRVFSHSRLSSLSDDEVGAFIESRLRAVGYRRNDLFPRGTVSEIARYSKGTPRLINIICDNALLIAYAESQKKVTADVIKEVARDLRLEQESIFGGYKAQHPPISSDHTEEHRDNHGSPIRAEPTLSGKAEIPISNGTVPPAVPEQPAPHSATEYVPRDFIDSLTRALTEAMGPMAPLVIRERLTLFGNSASLSKSTVEKLIELVSPEILDNVLRARFQKKVSALVEGLNGNSENRYINV
jgi:general secretion pathway protein A